MTYYPVTKEELEQIYANCAYPTMHNCDECNYGDPNFPLYCGFSRGRKLRNDILSRPDPLELLEAWRNYRSKNPYEDRYDWWNEEDEIIEILRTHPETLQEQGIGQGWWKE